MAKVIYENEVNGVHCSIELLNAGVNGDVDEDVLGYTIGTTGGLLSGEDLAIYIASLETGIFKKLAKASTHKIAFVNDLVRQGIIIDKSTYVAIYPEDGDYFDTLKK